MVKKKKRAEMGMDILFSKELPEDATQKMYDLLGEKSSVLSLSKSENTADVDCTRKGSVYQLAYMAMVLGFSDKRSQLGALVGLLFSCFTNPDDEDILKVILESIVANLDKDDDMVAVIDSVITCRAVRDDVMERVSKAKQAAMADDDKKVEATPFWIVPDHNTVQ